MGNMAVTAIKGKPLQIAKSMGMGSPLGTPMDMPPGNPRGNPLGMLLGFDPHDKPGTRGPESRYRAREQVVRAERVVSR